ncbi:MAG TPA: hypothetical protein VKZ53_13290 [Candidatus Angelobacter sp.]|nr:hypothetical protein [Candidatus Angelobacter sp.]
MPVVRGKADINAAVTMAIRSVEMEEAGRTERERFPSVPVFSSIRW